MQASLLEKIDSALSRFSVLSNAVNRAADRLVTKARAKACHPSGYTYCYSVCGEYCYSGTSWNGQQKVCYYREYQWLDRQGYPAPGCESVCADQCDCYKVVALTASCPTSCSGCTWA